MPSSSASVNFTPGDSSRSSHRISWRGPAAAARSWRRSAISTTRGSLAPPIDTRWAAYGATSAGQTIPLSSWWASTMHADVPADADPVRAHDDRVALAVLAEVGRPERIGVLRPELEDVADLDTVAQDDRLPAGRTGVALLGVGDVGDHIGLVVAPDVDVAQVVALAIRAGDEVGGAGDEVVDHHDRPMGAHRRAVARLHPRGLDLLDRRRADPAGRLVALTSLVSLTSWSPRTMAVSSRPSPATKNAALAVRAASIPRNAASDAMVVVPGVATSSSGSASSAAGSGCGTIGDLAVRGVAARLAQDEDVLAGGVEDHELVGQGPAHHADVGADRDRVEAEALEGPHVGPVLRPVAGVEPGLVAVAAVGVFHDELANADQPTARRAARLAISSGSGRPASGAGDTTGRCRRGAADDLLVGHREDHVAAVAVLEPPQLWPDRVVPPARPPDIGRDGRPASPSPARRSGPCSSRMTCSTRSLTRLPSGSSE